MNVFRTGCVWLLCVVAAPLFADAVTVTRLGSRSESVSGELALNTPRYLDDIARMTGLVWQGKPSLVLCTDQKAFENYVGSFPGGVDSVLGVAFPRDASIALNLDAIAQSGGTPESVYRHELCHLVLNGTIADHLRPLWFEEGLAQWVSRTPYEGAAAAGLFASGTGPNPLSLDDISQMARDPANMALGYAHAVAAVEDLVSRHGQAGLRRLLAALVAASAAPSLMRFEEVYGTTFETSFDRWEREFIEDRTHSAWWKFFGFFAQHWFELMTLLAVLALVVAIARKRRRDRRMIERWQEEDAMFPPDPSWAAAHAPERGDDQIVAESLEDCSWDTDQEDEWR